MQCAVGDHMAVIYFTALHADSSQMCNNKKALYYIHHGYKIFK